jgi:hypothetical protein
MKKGIDCASQISKAFATYLKLQGYSFVCRYLVPATMAWKRLTRTEAEIVTEAGLLILSIFESSANRAALGKAAGLTDGAAAFQEAVAIGQPEGSTIYFAVDYDAQPSDYDAIEAYLKAAASKITGYRIGVYGSYAVCEAMSKRGFAFCWQTYAWSKGKKYVKANVYQYKNGVTLFGITCDLNESYGSEGFWNLMSFEDALKVISGKAGISVDYWKERRDIDPNFELLIKKIASAV